MKLNTDTPNLTIVTLSRRNLEDMLDALDRGKSGNLRKRLTDGGPVLMVIPEEDEAHYA